MPREVVNGFVSLFSAKPISHPKQPTIALHPNARKTGARLGPGCASAATSFQLRKVKCIEGPAASRGRFAAYSTRPAEYGHVAHF